MWCVAFALVVVGVVADTANCTNYALASVTDSGFNWLIKGNSTERYDNVSVICASASNPARDNLNQRLSDLVNACVPAGVGSTTSALGVMVSLLNTVMCEQKTDANQLRYCLLSLLPLFDMTYFLSLASGGGTTFTIPPLQPVGDDLDRQTAMCVSPVCVAYVENLASSLLSQLPPSPAASTASDFIRGTVSRMRCGCTGVANPCESSVVTSSLISNTGGVQSFVEATACDSHGMPTDCARTWITCENVPPPQCAKPCAPGNIATVNFQINNLDWNCLQTLLAGNTLKIIRADVLANIPGLLDTDFECACGAVATSATGTQCTCNVTCATLALVQNVDLVKRFASLATNAAALVIPTPNLDKAVTTCKVVPSNFSFGSSFQLLSATTTLPKAVDTSASSTSLVGLSVVAVLFTSLVV